MKNKSGFTLVELLAILIVLVIIGVIAATSVSDILEQTTESSFKSSYDIIHKDVENRIKQIELGLDVDIECDDNSEDNNKRCSKIYELSEEDYKIKVAKVNDSYSLCVEGIGKFEDLNVEKNKNKALYTIIGNKFYNKISVKNIEQCNNLGRIEEIDETKLALGPENYDGNYYVDYVEYVGQKKVNQLAEISSEVIPNLETIRDDGRKQCIKQYAGATQGVDRINCLNDYNQNLELFAQDYLKKELEKETSIDIGLITSVINDDKTNVEINYTILDTIYNKILSCDVENEYKGCLDIIKQLQHKDLFCYYVGYPGGNLIVRMKLKKDDNGNYSYVKVNSDSCLGRN